MELRDVRCFATLAAELISVAPATLSMARPALSVQGAAPHPPTRLVQLTKAGELLQASYPCSARQKARAGAAQAI